ncbi:unnamed protein product [Closterium sp. Naga37s-1]|nr:unnamed protein product [Closterium sp. Naga37s-1]
METIPSPWPATNASMNAAAIAATIDPNINDTYPAVLDPITQPAPPPYVALNQFMNPADIGSALDQIDARAVAYSSTLEDTSLPTDAPEEVANWTNTLATDPGYASYPYKKPRYHPVYGLAVKKPNGKWYTYINNNLSWPGVDDWATGFKTCRFTQPDPVYGFNCTEDATCPGCPYCRAQQCFFNRHWPTYRNPQADGTIPGQMYWQRIIDAAINPKRHAGTAAAAPLLLPTHSPSFTLTLSLSLSPGVLGLLQLLLSSSLDESQHDMLAAVQATARHVIHVANNVVDSWRIENRRIAAASSAAASSAAAAIFRGERGGDGGGGGGGSAGRAGGGLEVAGRGRAGAVERGSVVRLGLESAVFDLRCVVDEVVLLVAGEAREKGVELAALVMDSVPTVVVGDPLRLRQVGGLLVLLAALGLESAVFDLRCVVDEVVLLVAGEAREKGVELAALVMDSVPTVVVGDPLRLRQVVLLVAGEAREKGCSCHGFRSYCGGGSDPLRLRQVGLRARQGTGERGEAREKGVELAALVMDSVPTVVVGDPPRLRQILANRMAVAILANLMAVAVRLTDRGHVFLVVRLAPDDDEMRRMADPNSPDDMEDPNYPDDMEGALTAPGQISMCDPSQQGGPGSGSRENLPGKGEPGERGEPEHAEEPCLPYSPFCCLPAPSREAQAVEAERISRGRASQVNGESLNTLKSPACLTLPSAASQPPAGRPRQWKQRESPGAGRASREAQAVEAERIARGRASQAKGESLTLSGRAAADGSNSWESICRMIREQEARFRRLMGPQQQQQQQRGGDRGRAGGGGAAGGSGEWGGGVGRGGVGGGGGGSGAVGSGGVRGGVRLMCTLEDTGVGLPDAVFDALEKPFQPLSLPLQQRFAAVPLLLNVAQK